MSFSASAKVVGLTSGPMAGEVPKAGGAPGVGGVLGVWASAVAEASRVSVLWVRNSRRDFDIGSSGAIVAGERRGDVIGLFGMYVRWGVAQFLAMPG
jgi:hypothetical protein